MRRHPWLTAAIVFAVLCAVLYFGVEWLAEQSWQRYTTKARARGVKLLFTDFALPEIPDEQNFAALPMLRAVRTSGGNPFDLPARPNSSPRMVTVDNVKVPWPSGPPPFGNAVRGEKIDWEAWRKYFQEVGFLTETSDNPARDTLRALEHYAPLFPEWSQWRTRPQCRFPHDLTKGLALPLPHLSMFQGAAKVFGLRMRAHLALGDFEAAYTDFQDAFQAYRALKDGPALISGLVRNSILAALLDAVGDGLRDHRWADESLRKIDSELATVQPWADYRFALGSERGCANSTYEVVAKSSMQQRAQMVAASVANQGPARWWLVGAIPKSVWRANELRQNCYFDELLARTDPAGPAIDLDRATPSSPEQISDPLEQRYYFFFRFWMDDFRRYERRYIKAQTLLDEARLACALERFRLARGAYPEVLTELVPAFIEFVPTDIYARAPYRYQRVGETSFRLYSVGENRQDDGGQIVPGVPEGKQPDAIWLYAPQAAP